jgi:hypothetical protein
MATTKTRWIILAAVILALAIAGLWSFNTVPALKNLTYKVGDPVDSLNGVIVYYNGNIANITERNVAADNYNLGLKYQCVEFVKRYYYQHLHHKMPNSYGHAKDFFDRGLADGKKNRKRNLVQYSNPSRTKPKADDLLVFDGTVYGHVAIISKVGTKGIEIIQQNPGPAGKSRRKLSLEKENGKWKIDSDRVLGWLRKE